MGRGHNIIQMVVKKNNAVLLFFFTTIFIITNPITEWLLFPVLLMGS